MSHPSNAKFPPSGSQASSAARLGLSNFVRSIGGRILIVLLVLALLVDLFIRVALPAIGCKSAASNAPVGAVSQFCFGAFSGGHAIGRIVAGPDGNIWFTEPTSIGRITPTGTITEFPFPGDESTPGDIVAGPDGNLWFVEQTAKTLGRITPKGVVTQFPLPPGATYPMGLAAGPDGALWYTRSPNVFGGGPPDTGTPGLIGRMTISGSATEFTLPTPTAPRPPAQPRDIISGPDGALWFDTGMTNGVASGNSWIGRITTGGQASMIYAPDPKSLVNVESITMGPDHNIWFTQTSDNINSEGPSQQQGSPQEQGNQGLFMLKGIS